jgi:hypothetical protein
MGQQASKAAKNISSRLSVAAKKSTAPAQRFTDPSATDAGFTRGEGPANSDGSAYRDPRDEKQRQFLEKQAGGDSKFKEMLDDLLVDAGPLVKKEKKTRLQAKFQPTGKDNSRTPHQPNSIPIDEETGKAVESSPRRREAMPLAKDVEGFTTTRTTSFSYKQDQEDIRDFGVGDVLDIYDLVARKHTLPSINAAVESFYKDRVKDRDIEWTDEETQQHHELLRQALEYIEIPVVMKDTDDSYIGAWPERVEELKQLKIVEMPKTKVKLVMEDLLELKKEKNEVV